MRIGTVVPMAEGDAHDGIPEWGEIRAFAQRAEAVGDEGCGCAKRRISQSIARG